MEYVIQCRFSPSVTNLRPLRELFPWAADAVLFAYSFTADQDLSGKQAANVLEDMARGLQVFGGEFGHVLQIDAERVVDSSGSVILTLFVTSVILNVHTIANTASQAAGIAVWAADKVLGGVLGAYGAELAHSVKNRLVAPDSPMRSPQHIADEQAQQIAMQHGGVAVSISGGLATKLSDGKTQGFKYSYQVVGPTPGYIIIVTDLYARRPVEYSFSEIPEPDGYQRIR